MHIIEQAYAYREAEKPFILYNVPSLDAAAARWQNPSYISEHLGNEVYR
jgi:hypothetical protein